MFENEQEIVRRAGIVQKIAEEVTHPENEGVYYISFADESGFLGGCFVHAYGPVSACEEAHNQGCNPGGEAAIWGPVPPPVDHGMNRLLSKEEIETLPPKDISIEDIAKETEEHQGDELCGATHPQVGHGQPCIRFKGHDEYDGQRNHITSAGVWFG